MTGTQKIIDAILAQTDVDYSPLSADRRNISPEARQIADLLWRLGQVRNAALALVQQDIAA